MATLTVYIEPSQRLWLDLLATEAGCRSRSQFVRLLVQRAVEERLTVGLQKDNRPAPKSGGPEKTG